MFNLSAFHILLALFGAGAFAATAAAQDNPELNFSDCKTIQESYLDIRKHLETKGHTQALRPLIDQISSRQLSNECSYTWHLLDISGQISLNLISSERALESHRKALDLVKKYDSRWSNHRGVSHYQIGLILYRRSNYTDSEIHLNNSVTYLADSERKDLLVESLIMLGNVKRFNSKYNLAIDYLNLALDIVNSSNKNKLKLKIVEIRSLIGKTLNDSGSFSEAVRMQNDLLRYLEEQDPKNERMISHVLNSIGKAYYRLGSHGKSIKFHRKALRLRKRLFGDRSLNVSYSMINLAKPLSNTSEYREAESLFIETIKLQKRILPSDHSEIAISTAWLGRFYLGRGMPEKAFPFLAEAIQIHQKRANSARYLPTDKTVSERDIGRHVSYLLAATRQIYSQDNADWRHVNATLVASQVLFERRSSISIRKMARRLTVADSKYRSLLHKLQNSQERLNALIGQIEEELVALKQDGKSRINFLRKKLNVEQKDKDDAEAELKRKYPKYDHVFTNPVVDIRKLQKFLKNNEILAKFEILNKRLNIWIISRNKARWLQTRIDLNSDKLERVVRSLRCGLSAEEWHGAASAERCIKFLGLPRVPEDDAPLPFDLNLAHELYKDLFGEVEDLIEGRHLLIVPSGPLTSLPFQVLVTEKPKTGMPKGYAGYRDVAWLGARQPISVLPSVSSLVALRENAKASLAPRKYAGYGNPVLDGNEGCYFYNAPKDCSDVGGGANTRGVSLDLTFSGGASSNALLTAVRRLCPLPDTKLELECIAKNLGVDDSELRVGDAATEAEIKGRKDLDQYRVLHFATHGIVAGDIEKMARRQGEPALVMTPPETPADENDDGLLTASEITQLDLDADWVILSACNTASGDKLGSEALSGLARAFFYAGARSLLVSHWPVYSDAAVSMTTTVFDRMGEAERAQKPISRAEAMRQAMVAMMKSGSYADNPHPSVWAPFSIVGEGARGRPQPRQR